LVENQVIVELITVDTFINVHIAKVLTYLKFADKKIGLHLNYNVKNLKQGIKRPIL